MTTKTSKPSTKIQKVMKFFESGKTLTAAQALQRFDVKNLRATVTNIRQNYGLMVEGIRKTNSRGEDVTVYGIGQAATQAARRR